MRTLIALLVLIGGLRAQEEVPAAEKLVHDVGSIPDYTAALAAAETYLANLRSAAESDPIDDVQRAEHEAYRDPARLGRLVDSLRIVIEAYQLDLTHNPDGRQAELGALASALDRAQKEQQRSVGAVAAKLGSFRGRKATPEDTVPNEAAKRLMGPKRTASYRPLTADETRAVDVFLGELHAAVGRGDWDTVLDRYLHGPDAEKRLRRPEIVSALKEDAQAIRDVIHALAESRDDWRYRGSDAIYLPTRVAPDGVASGYALVLHAEEGQALRLVSVIRTRQDFDRRQVEAGLQGESKSGVTTP